VADYTIQRWYNPGIMIFNLEPSALIARVVVLIVAFSVHEFAHAWTADQLGDDCWQGLAGPSLFLSTFMP
jgi:hypothetical protein